MSVTESKPSGSPPVSMPIDKRDQFQLLIENVIDYAIFMLDTQGRVSTWNAGAERIKQYKASEIIGQHFSKFYPDEDVRSGKPAYELEVAAKDGRFEDEGWRIRKDGTRFWANVIITAIKNHRGELVGFGKVTRDFTERKQHEQEVVQSEQLLRLLVEGIPDYALYMLDPKGQITTWNPGAERIKGYKAKEIIGKNFSLFFLGEDIQTGKPQEILERARTEGRAEHEGWRVRKDGSRFWVNAVVTALRNKAGDLIGFSKITRDITERMEHQKALEAEIVKKEQAQLRLAESEESLRELSINLLRTQDEERRRIGREMHDSLGQYLSATKIKLGMLALKCPTSGAELKDELNQCSNLLEECVKEVRTISYLLYPPMLEERGFVVAVSWYLDGFTQRSGIEVRFHTPPNFERLPSDIELALFRVVQESLTNVHKHAESKIVDITLTETDENVALEIRDYGKGLPKHLRDKSNTALSASVGVGLRGMSERMAQLGGTLGVEGPETGTLVRATVPSRLRKRSKKANS